jgi:hypothetical protein
MRVEHRLSKLEEQTKPVQKGHVGYIHHDLDGNCTHIELSGQRFERIGGESEEAMRTRAIEAAGGPFDTLLTWVSWVRPEKQTA